MKKRAVFVVLAGSTAAAVAAAGTIAANANWAIPGTAKIKVQSAEMPNGTRPSVAKQSEAAVVSWSAQEITAGVKMDRYTVIAHSQNTPSKSTIIREVAASGGVSESVTFSAVEVAGGRWKWTVIPRFAKWNGAESGLSKALNFPATAVDALVEAPAAKAVAPTTPPVTARPAIEPSSPPVAEPVSPSPMPTAARTEDETPPPPATTAAELEPTTVAPEPSASGSAEEDIPR